MTRSACCVLASLLVLLAALPAVAEKPNGNRLTYLDEPCNPWYPHRDFPKLTTPMWVGEEGVEAVVILGIDDMRGHEKWEAYLRPILNRLKQIDGRAPVSIFTCSIDPKHPHLQQWLEEGLSLEIHTIDHPCPLLKDGDLAKAKSTVDRCIDLLNEVPKNKPVCFRMPCCDSLNTLSPRFYTEIFNKTTPKGNFLLANSSVMQVFTSADPALPRELVLEPLSGTALAAGESREAASTPAASAVPLTRERFKKYLPTDRFFTNSIENYPYPFVVDRLCWEFPCVAPSDWAAQHFHKPHNPQTVEDWKAALDCTVIKQGVFCLVFHPHNWIKPEQINELIDHAVTKHGKKVKFLNFREAVERLNKNVLGGRSLRDENAQDAGIRLLDINHDGYLDVVDGASHHTRLWDSKTQAWIQSGFPVDPRSPLVRFVPDGGAHFIQNRHDGCGVGVADAATAAIWVWMEGRWQGPNPAGGLMRWPFGHPTTPPTLDPKTTTMLVRDFRNRGGVSLVVIPHKLSEHENPRMRLAHYAVQDGRTGAFPIGFPEHLQSHWGSGRHGWRFVDLDEDGIDDLFFSNSEEYFVALARVEKEPYIDWKRGSSLLFDVILQGKRGSKPAEQELPPIERADGSNNGFWVHARQLVWMNEDTAKSKDLVERRSFDQLLANVRAQPRRAEGRQPPDDSRNADGSRPSNDVRGLTPSGSPKTEESDLGPKSPEASLKLMQVKPGYRVELVAAEPLVRDPVAFDWGPDGKLWVAEMADYPLGVGEGEEADNADVDLRSRHAPRDEPKRDTTPNAQDASTSVKRSARHAERDGYKKGGGRVRFLEDTDGDGKYDKSTVFLDKLNFPNGVMPWRDGVLISAAPEVLFARDTNGDGRADEVKVLLTGFGEGNQQHRVNGFSWGLDNMVHCANGDSGGAIKVVGTLRVPSDGDGDGTRSVPTTIDIRGRDFRWNPDTGEIDPTSGQTQFGRNRDDFGNWFGNNNANPMYHFVLDDYYIRRNPHVAPPDPRKPVSINPGPSPVFPISRTLARFNDFAMANRFTSANSAMVYRDDLLFERSRHASREERRRAADFRSPTDRSGNADPRPAVPHAEREGYIQHVFISEPVHNLVHHEVMTADGVTFTSRRADDEQQSEFLASRDNWFRPTQIKTGPDGALYIADMYRQVIEHPQYIPPALQAKLDLRAGHDKGRIYRVVPINGLQRRVEPGDEDEEPIVWPLSPAKPRRHGPSDPRFNSVWQALKSPNGTIRDLAHRMIYWQCVDAGDVTWLSLQEASPNASLPILSIIDGVGMGKRGDKWRELWVALQDRSPALRRRGLQALERFEAEIPNQVFSLLSGMGRDPDPFVRMQFAYTLGHPKLASLGHELGRLLYHERDDKYLVAAAMSSIHEQNVASVVAHVFESAGKEPLPPQLASALLGLASTLGNDPALFSLIEYVLNAPPEGGTPALAQMLDNLERRKTSLAELKDVAPQRLAQAQQRLAEVLAAARKTVTDFQFEMSNSNSRIENQTSQIENVTLAALSLLGREKATRTDDAKLIGMLLVPQSAVPLQTAAVTTLARIDDPESAIVLLSGWRTFTPALRTQVLDALLSRPSWTETLLDALAAKMITPSDVDAARRQRLIAHSNQEIRARAAKLLDVPANVDRQTIVAEFAVKLKALSAAGDASSGAEVFKKRCATCHKLKDIGTSVGSDLMSLTDKSNAALLTAILDPNKAVEAKFLAYTAVNTQGQVFSGMIAAETGNSITLMAADGKQHTLLRADLDEFVGSAKSFMPEGLEKDVSPRELADVIAFVQSSGPPPKKFDGNKPEAVTADKGGKLFLLATNAEIYGRTLVFEAPFQNLGYWGSLDDRAVWTINVTKPGRHSIRLNYACHNSTAGNEVVIEAAGQSVQAKIVSTGTWENYQTAILGELNLPAGQHRVTVRAAETLKNHLMDLKELRLVPE